MFFTRFFLCLHFLAFSNCGLQNNQTIWKQKRASLFTASPFVNLTQ